MLRWVPRSRTLRTTEVVAGVGKESGEAAGGAVKPAVPSQCQLSPSSQCDTGHLTVCLFSHLYNKVVSFIQLANCFDPSE